MSLQELPEEEEVEEEVEEEEATSSTGRSDVERILWGPSGWWQLGVRPSSNPLFPSSPGPLHSVLDKDPPLCLRTPLFQLDDVIQRYWGNDAQSIGGVLPCQLLMPPPLRKNVP